MSAAPTTRRRYVSVVGLAAAAGTSGCLGGGTELPCGEAEPPSAAFRERDDEATPRLIAHRGCAEQYPENTRYAFERVAPYVDSIELDVRRCGSGEIVVFHDETLGRVTSCEGAVSDTPYETLDSCSVGCLDEGVPRLVDAFETIPTDVEVNVELKEQGLAEDVSDVAAAFDHDVLVSSFDPDTLSAVAEIDPSLPLGLVTNANLARSLEAAREIGCSYLHPRHDLRDLPEVVVDARDSGIEVNPWTIATERSAARAIELDVAGLIIDRLDVV